MHKVMSLYLNNSKGDVRLNGRYYVCGYIPQYKCAILHVSVSYVVFLLCIISNQIYIGLCRIYVTLIIQRCYTIGGRKSQGQAYVQDSRLALWWGAIVDLHQPLQALSS